MIGQSTQSLLKDVLVLHGRGFLIYDGQSFLYLETEVFVLPGQGFHGSGGTLKRTLDLHHLHRK